MRAPRRTIATAVAAAAAIFTATGLSGCSGGVGRTCLDVPTELLAVIAGAATRGVIEPVSGAAVKADPASAVHADGSYIVAVTFRPVEASEGATRAAAFVTGSLEASEAQPILAVDPLAQILTVWPSEVNGIGFAGDDDGIAAAKACVEDDG
ncbi:hypothetical protein ET445_10355 [Agromyces protaetiae]|uniref:Uncharacterized protein n=1 Tax=Agromyces protaetiae TaxID=2509455 RepID=A0A4P6FCX0_9MICO|nr:hypothetical protein [Agromyces protaetiae]QAY73685.1 hypothetical protein ET445_10355 [Agromyces protaetiae]